MLLRAGLVVLAAGIPLAACYKPAGARDVQPVQHCPEPDTGPRAKWRHGAQSAAIASLAGDPHHSANDPIVNPGSDVVVHGKFAYGMVSKDLEDEEVSLWLRMKRCGAWHRISRGMTDSDGRIAMAVPRAMVPVAGAYPFQLVVHGDRSRAHGTIYVLPHGTEVVLFDIDGTLTTGDSEVVEQTAFGSDPQMRRGARDLVTHYVESGYMPIYLTGRPYLLRPATASWLTRRSFPPGPVITTDRFSDSAPGHDNVGQFKRDVLYDLRQAIGLDIVAAYGNADSDVCAYARAGIDPERTFIFGSEPKRCHDHPASEPIVDYVQHLQSLRAQRGPIATE